MSQPFRILSLDGGGMMGAFAATARATVVRETDRRIVSHDDLMSRRNAAAPSEHIDFCHDHFGFSSIFRTCTLAEAHSRPGLVTVEASGSPRRPIRTHGIQQLLQGIPLGSALLAFL